MSILANLKDHFDVVVELTAKHFVERVEHKELGRDQRKQKAESDKVKVDHPAGVDAQELRQRVVHNVRCTPLNHKYL